VIAVSSRPARNHWNTISFSSTLYLLPILDLLLKEIPSRWRSELRLGLQEALVNAAKHGNKLDPRKKVLVHFYVVEGHYWWIITDQGSGFRVPKSCSPQPDNQHPCEEQECGRGLYILHQIFDHVQWNSQGTELKLCKRVAGSYRDPLLS
jgi:serine/threonine-protein kinase RsbW